jgi:hypothetical protein
VRPREYAYSGCVESLTTRLTAFDAALLRLLLLRPARS